MRKPRHSFFRTLAVLALLVSSLSFFALPAASAPQAPETRAAMAQTATGTVSVTKYLCDGLDGVVWNGTVGDTCVLSAGAFDFYLYGDGTDASWPLEVDGTGTIDLAAGTYLVLERGTWTGLDIEVVAGEVTYVTVQNPSGDPLPPPEPVTGTVTVSKYICDGLDVVTWGGTPDENCVAGAATFYFYLIGDGSDYNWPLAVDGSASIELPVGTYEVYEDGYWSAGSVTVTEGGNAGLTVLNPGDPLPPPAPETGFVEVSKFFCPGVDAVTYDTSVLNDDCYVGDATFAFYLYGDGTDEYWPLTLGADGVGTIELAVGTYAVVEQGTFTSVDVEVTADATTELVVINPGVEPEPDPGWVEVNKYYCEDADEAAFLGDDDVFEDCTVGPATFTFYLVGDGTDDYWQLDVWEDGYGMIELAPGTYEVYEEGTGIMTTIEVVSGETALLEAVNPGAAPAPRDGTVNISKFYCTNITETQFNSDGFQATFAAASLPTFEPACEPGAATFTFYLVGDGTDDYWQIDVDGTGSIELAPGTYEVVEEGTLASAFVTVPAGDFINLDVLNPTGEYEPGSSVNVVKFYCDTVTETEFLSFSGSEYSERDELPTAPDCVSGPATFTFYLVGDGTAEYAQLHVDGSGTIGLEPGIYEVVEEGTQAHFEFEVFEDDNTMLVVNNPMPDDGEVPDDGDDDADDGDDADKDTADGKDEADSSTGGVTKLPSTGSGTSDSTGVLAMAAAAAAALSGAGALTLRKKG